jgi:hypothetical protein
MAAGRRASQTDTDEEIAGVIKLIVAEMPPEKQ